MIITKLTLRNFGVYAGINTFEFSNSGPIVLIGGLNGRGKTTFLEAVLLALYGANSFAYNESIYRSYGQYLKSYVNTADQSLESFVELEFKLNEDTSERYLINRSWTGIGQRTREKIFVKKNGNYNDFLTENWSLFIENILPSGLSNFFFFDGEKIAEQAVDNSNVQMKESIKTLLGISVLDTLKNDLSRIISRIAKNSKNHRTTKELELFREKKNIADAALQTEDDKIRDISFQIEKTKKNLEKAKLEYSAKGGDIVSQKQDLFQKRCRLSGQVVQENEHLVNIAAGVLPLLQVKDLLFDIQTQANKEYDIKLIDYTIQKMNAMYTDFVSNRSTDKNSIRKFIDYVKKKSTEDRPEIIYNLSDQSLYQLNSLLGNGLLLSKDETLKSMAECKKLQSKIREIDDYLNVDIDESSLAKIYKKIKTLENKIIDLQETLKNNQKNRVSLHGDALRAESEYNNFLEGFLAELEFKDDNDRIIKYAYQAISILEEFKTRLQERKIGTLADTMTSCYKQLANKKKLIDRISIDSKTLDIFYLNSQKHIVPKESLSAGEKQLMVISLLWALAICSKKKLPVIIDTPLSRMDSNHRVSLITTYFPNASDQTIILSTDSEIDKHYYMIMKENIGDEFTLKYNDEKKCSTISKGYFAG